MAGRGPAEPVGGDAIAPAVCRCDFCEVRSRAVCGAMDRGDLAALNAMVRQSHVRRLAALFHEGDAADQAFNLTGGVIRLSKMLADGRRQITGFAYPGDFLGLSVGDAYVDTAEAVSDVTVCRLARRDLDRLFVRFPELGRRLLAKTSRELAGAHEQMLLLGRKTARERLASFLVMIARKAGPFGVHAGEVYLPMDRTDIADYLGLTTETVSRTFTQLRKDRLILTPNRATVLIDDPDRLEALAQIETPAGEDG